MKISMGNEPDAVRSAMVLCLAIKDRWCRVADLERCDD